MNKFGMLVKFTAQPGQRDALAQLLLEAAKGLESIKGCDLYLVNVSDDEPDAIWVSELWNDAEAHVASLNNEEAKALIGRARTLIANIEPIKLRPLGGKGLEG